MNKSQLLGLLLSITTAPQYLLNNYVYFYKSSPIKTSSYLYYIVKSVLV